MSCCTEPAIELYDADAKKWVVGSDGFTDSLAFLKTLYDEQLAVSPAEALDANVWKKVFGEWLPQGKMGATVEGSYSPSFWQKGGSYEWPEYGTGHGRGRVPHAERPGTRRGQHVRRLDPGGRAPAPRTRTWPSSSWPPRLNQKNSLAFNIASSQIAVREDVAADAGYQAANPFVKDVSELVSVTHYRPATADYPRISAAVQEATEAVITGAKSPEQAAADYDTAVAGIVGGDKTVRK